MALHINLKQSGTEDRSRLKDDSLPIKHISGVSKRLQKELMHLMMSNEEGISAFPDGDNIFKWIGTISGPINTVYSNQTYRLSLLFPNSYPYTAPVVKFKTPCFHPNVGPQGSICLDILKDKWSALYDVRTILLFIQSLLQEPIKESPLNVQAATMWNNPGKYKKIHDAFNGKHKRI